MTKSLAQYFHAKKRAWERYGLILSEPLYAELNEIALHSPVYSRRTNRITNRRFTWKDYELRVIFDSHRNQIVTFLPPKTPLKTTFI